MGPPGHRRGLRPDVRRGFGQLARRAADTVHPLGDVRHRARAGAQRRPLLVRPFRRGDVQTGQHHGDPDGGARGVRTAQRFGLDKRDTLPAYCRGCDVRFACHGGCPKDRFIETPDGEPGLNYLCAGYKAFFGHIDRPMRAMSDLLRQGRAPSELVEWYATEDAAAGRGEPRRDSSCSSSSPWPCSRMPSSRGGWRGPWSRPRSSSPPSGSSPGPCWASWRFATTTSCWSGCWRRPS